MLAPADEAPRRSGGNCFVGSVIKRVDGEVSAEIVLDIGQGKTITATITRGSGETLDLAVGERAQALIKASHVILAVD